LAGRTRCQRRGLETDGAQTKDGGSDPRNQETGGLEQGARARPEKSQAQNVRESCAAKVQPQAQGVCTASPQAFQNNRLDESESRKAHPARRQNFSGGKAMNASEFTVTGIGPDDNGGLVFTATRTHPVGDSDHSVQVTIPATAFEALANFRFAPVGEKQGSE
jgi:hypothetical protein